MPNIIVVGRSSLEVIEDVSRVCIASGVKPKDGVITYSPEMVCCDMSVHHSDTPYLIVRDTDVVRAMKIASNLNKELRWDVEIEILHAFISKDGEVEGQAKPEFYLTTEATPIDLKKLEQYYPGKLEWLRREAKENPTWTSFQKRTEHGCIEAAKGIMMGDWQDSPLVKLQSDLMAQVGIYRKELGGGPVSESFLKFIS